MSKYSSAFKHEVVEYYGDGERSYREAGQRIGLDHPMVLWRGYRGRRWIALHLDRDDVNKAPQLAEAEERKDATLRTLEV